MDCNQPHTKTSGTGGTSATSHPPSESTYTLHQSFLPLSPLHRQGGKSGLSSDFGSLAELLFPMCGPGVTQTQTHSWGFPSGSSHLGFLYSLQHSGIPSFTWRIPEARETKLFHVSSSSPRSQDCAYPQVKRHGHGNYLYNFLSPSST